MADKRDILVRLLGEETVSRMAGKAGDGLDKFGDSLDAAEKDAKGLDAQIAEVEGSLKTLAVAFARTSDAADRMDITKAMRKQQTELRKLTSSRKLLPDFTEAGEDAGKDAASGFATSFTESVADVGEEAASGFAVSFMQRIGPLMAKAPMGALNPAVVAIGAPLAAGVATLLGTAAAGAIIGGVGIGGVAGGIALAAKDPAVKAAGTKVGEDLSDMLARASAAFVPETINAIDTVRDRALRLEPAFTRAFDSASRLLDPLLDGLLDAGESVIPGVIDALDAAPPVIDSIADGLRGIGDALGDSLSDLSEFADEGARALNLLFEAMEIGIRTTSHVVENLALLYGGAEKLAALASGDLPTFYRLMTEDGATAADTSGDLADGIDGVGTAAGIAAGKAVKLIDALQILNGIQLSANEAERGFQAAVDDAREAFDGKVKSIDLGTERGRTYSEALDGIATSAKTSAQAIYDQTGNVNAANAKIEEGRTALYKQARQYGLSETAAWDYVNSVLSIPKKWSTVISTPGMPAALTSAKLLKQRIDSIDRRIDIRAKLTTSYGGGAHTGQGYSTGYSAGGPVHGPGPKGVDSKPAMLAPGEHVFTADEVDAAGGHAGVERIRALLRGGGRGGGAMASVAPATAGGGAVASGAAPQLVRIGSDGSRMGDLLMEILRKQIGDRGGNVQFVLGR